MKKSLRRIAFIVFIVVTSAIIWTCSGELLFIKYRNIQSSCSHEFTQFRSCDGKSIIIIDEHMTYMIVSNEVYRVNRHHIHLFGVIVLKNPGEIGRVLLDGSREKAQYFDAHLEGDKKELGFTTLDGCFLRITR